MGTDLNVGILRYNGERVDERKIDVVKNILSPEDKITPLTVKDKTDNASFLSPFDLLVLFGVAGFSPVARMVAVSKVPVFVLHSYYGFHTFHSSFYRILEKSGGVALPANSPAEISSSIAALRAKKSLNNLKLLVVLDDESKFREEMIKTFSEGAAKNLKIEIVKRYVSELKKTAASFTDMQADEELKRWYSEILEEPKEMSDLHMRQVAKLYLAEKRMIEETKTVGITVDDIAGFLLKKNPDIMPNVSYGPLVFDGFLACEEADIEALTTELILKSALGIHPTMSNIYLSFQDKFDSLPSYKEYTPEMEFEDYQQSLKTNYITVAHFSASGVLSLDMMEEKKYKVRETLPAWPGQSMIVSTPKFGKMVLARISQDSSEIHIVPGECDKRSFGDKYGWYRGRWFIKISSVRDFIKDCLHHHYAISLENNNFRVLEILVEKLLRLKIIRTGY